MDKYNKIGIDRIVFKAIDPNNINVKILKENFLFLENGEYYRVMIDKTGEKIKVSYIKIKNDELLKLKFNELNVGIKKVKDKLIPYEYLDVTLPSVLSDEGVNIKNISSVESLKECIELLELELNKCGILNVDLKSAEIEELEINVNIPLQNQFKDYERALNYIKDILPKTLKKGQEYEDRVENKYTGFKVFNNSISLKFYDKRAQVLEEHKRDIGEELLRIEYRLLSGTKVKELLGHNEVSKLLSEFDNIEKAFRKRLEKDLVLRLYKSIEEEQKASIKLLKRYKKSGKGAVDSLLKNHELLDIELALSAYKEIEKVHYARECKRAIKSALEVERENMLGNINKINEILEGMGYKKIELNITKSIKKELEKCY
ncbi:hypothetical protein ACV3KU_15625 [Clostridium perfringens]|uniref:hypothetical protein n=1 Tax=Clostridium perfringens TaxID=1502 RepID=UPI0039EAB546